MKTSCESALHGGKPMSHIFTAQIQAMEARLLKVESTSTQGYAGLQLIGNASKICNDGKERAKASLENLDYYIPAKRIVISIAPADIKKNGNQFDLPIAMSLLHLLNEEKTRLAHENWLFASELSLNGELRPVKGVIPFVLAAAHAKLNGIVVAPENLKDIAALKELSQSYLSNLKICGAHNLSEIIPWLMQTQTSLPLHLKDFIKNSSSLPKPAFPTPNYNDMALNPEMERAAITVAAGKHNILLRGVPGSGKSMWAQRLHSIMSPLPPQEHLEVLKVYSVYTHLIPPTVLQGLPPSRSPHHQASSASLMGSLDQPGDISLAHRGILFLDEITEFRRDFIESMREPLEAGEVHISRSKAKVSWHSRILLVAACNNCPCGWFGSSQKKCRCTIQTLMNYQKKLSGPILDRIDIHINFHKPASKSLHVFMGEATQSKKMPELIQKVQAAQEFAHTRNKDLGVMFNSELKAEHIWAASRLSAIAFKALLEKLLQDSLSTRSQIRILRVARTLADIDKREMLTEQDISQAKAWHHETQESQKTSELGGFA